jgi:hypothetical protein
MHWRWLLGSCDFEEPPARLAGQANAAEEVAGGDCVPAIVGLESEDASRRRDDGHELAKASVIHEDLRARHVPAHLLLKA